MTPSPLPNANTEASRETDRLSGPSVSPRTIRPFAITCCFAWRLSFSW